MLSWEVAGTEVDRRHGVVNPRVSWTGGTSNKYFPYDLHAKAAVAKLVHSVIDLDQASGTVRPSALALFRLSISSTFVDCCTGRSAGFSLLRIRPT